MAAGARFNVYMSVEMKNELTAIAQSMGCPLSSLVTVWLGDRLRAEREFGGPMREKLAEMIGEVGKSVLASRMEVFDEQVKS